MRISLDIIESREALEYISQKTLDLYRADGDKKFLKEIKDVIENKLSRVTSELENGDNKVTRSIIILSEDELRNIVNLS